jgi:dTDP-4-dehydrorhamnose reductase
MKHVHSPKILVLGTNGMLGSVVYSYFQDIYPDNTWGTTRNGPQEKIFSFDAFKIENLYSILKALNGLDYIINCIGALNSNPSKQEQIYLNSYFPHQLVNTIKNFGISLIHVSSDAVFSPQSGTVTEIYTPTPSDQYGMTKYLGEPETSHCITFRTSLLGINSSKPIGLLDWAIHNKNKSIPGFTNQNWSGCTTLQFARLCELIIKKNQFNTLSETSSIFHFVPIKNVSKYKIVKTLYMELSLDKEIRSELGIEITRKLDTAYESILSSYYQSQSIQAALHELILFEKTHHEF